MAEDFRPSGFTELSRLGMSNSPSQAEMLEEVSRLRREYMPARILLSATESQSGPLAGMVDFAKNHLGGDPNSNHSLSSLWGEVFDKSKGSFALEQESRRENVAIEQLAKDAQSNQTVDFGGTYKQLTGTDFVVGHEQTAHLPLLKQLALYQRSQARMVDSLSDAGSALAATVVQYKFKGSKFYPIMAAALTKPLVKSAEPLYRHPVRDTATGAVDGFSMVVAAGLGARTNEAINALPAAKWRTVNQVGRAAAVEGVGGSIFGAVTGPMREYFAARDSNTTLTTHDLVHAASRDAKTGFLLGLPFGF